MSTPVVLENGELFGTLCAVDPDPYEFNQSEIKTIKRLANILSTLISKKQISTIPTIEEKILKLDKLALVGQLSAGLAHEIRNPMQSVRGFIQLLFDDGKLDKYKNIVLSELDRINQLLNDFLLVTQPSAPKKVKGSVVVLIQNTIEFLKSEATLHNIDILFEDKENVPEIYFDSSQLRQVFINLIKNAIEAIGNNGEIKLCIVQEEDFIYINIKDSGPGIPLSIINKIGDPFFSTKDTGIGLGLSICKTIVKEHNGNINIENHEDGTLVSVKLPI